MSLEITHGSFTSCRVSRRSLVGGMTAALSVAALGRSGASAHSEPVVEGRTYAATLGDQIHLAIVVSAREAYAFLTDGAGRADFFTGQSSRSMTLESANGARLTASIELEGFEGRIVNADGSSFSFVAPLATGIAGLYAVEIGEGYATGFSNSGARLMAGTVSVPDDTGILLHGIITSERSGSCPIAARVSPESWGKQWWIVNGDGVVTGGCPDSQGFGFAHTSGSVD